MAVLQGGGIEGVHLFTEYGEQVYTELAPAASPGRRP